MNILILSSSHPYKMSGIVAHDLYKNLNQIPGNNVKLLVKPYEKYPDENIIPIQSKVDYLFFRIRTRFTNEFEKLFNKSKRKTIETDPDYYIFEPDEAKTFYSTNKILKRSGFKADIILVLFMTSFISYKNLYEINRKTKAPIFIFMMDMAPMTGGCHYAWECKGYLDKCGYCPAFFSKSENDQSKVNLSFKKKYVDKTNLVVLAGSEWQFKQLQKSSLFTNKNKYKLLLGIDQELFRPINKVKARNELNLPIDKKIIFFAAVSAYEKRKGFHKLTQALTILKKSYKSPNQIHLAVAGNTKDMLLSEIPFEYTLLGYLDIETLAKAMGAADVFANTSIEDSGPMMINQAVMCGTPVVAFEMGVALDLVITGKTGYLAENGIVSDLANGINYILNLSGFKYEAIQKNCRNLGLRLCSHESQINRLLEYLK